MTEQPKILVINEDDNVATALEDLAVGATVSARGQETQVSEAIRFGHKFALLGIPKGGYIVKYGARIGIASSDINAGEHVHVHNVRDIVDEVRRSGRNRVGEESS